MIYHNKTTAIKEIKKLKKEYNDSRILFNIEMINKRIGYIELISINPYNNIKLLYFLKNGRFD